MSLKPWIRIGQPLEAVIEDWERILDAWEAGGIRGLVFGRLTFRDDDGAFTIPAFESNAQIFRDRGFEVGESSGKSTDPAREK